MFSSRKVILDKQKTDALNKINGTQEELNLYKESLLNGAYPELYGDLVAVTIDNDGTVKKADTTKMWYSYENKIWANAVILNSEDNYDAGDIISENDINSYFVWIPRYRYKIFNDGNYTSAINGTPSSYGSSVQTIEVVFESKLSVKSIGSITDEWLTHPAFTLGNRELNGIWVGKFETTGQIRNTNIKPSAVAIKSSNVKEVFEIAYNYKRDLDSHLIKNTEWGAVAYLSHSEYGINEKISSNDNASYLTGYSATSPYNTVTGYKASTTGNISGIYDMSGGLSDAVAAYAEGNYETIGFNNISISNYASKYFDVYPSNSTSVTYDNRILGDATGEMGPFYIYNDEYDSYYSPKWYSSSSNFIDSSNGPLSRGGAADGGNLNSQFNFTSTSIEFGFHIVLTP